MPTKQEQMKFSQQLGQFLKGIKLVLTTQVNLLYAILTEKDMKVVMNKISQKEIPILQISEIILDEQYSRTVERFCLRIIQFIQYRLNVLKQMKIVWIISEINLFQNGLKKILSQIKTIRNISIIVKKIVDCQNVFVRNILNKLLLQKRKFLQGQHIQIKQFFNSKLLRGIRIKPPQYQSIFLDEEQEKRCKTKLEQSVSINQNSGNQAVENIKSVSTTILKPQYYIKKQQKPKIKPSIEKGTNNQKVKQNFRRSDKSKSIINSCSINQQTLKDESTLHSTFPTLTSNNYQSVQKINCLAEIKKLLDIQENPKSSYIQQIKQLSCLNKKNNYLINKYLSKIQKNKQKILSVQKLNIINASVVEIPRTGRYQSLLIPHQDTKGKQYFVLKTKHFNKLSLMKRSCNIQKRISSAVKNIA